MSNSTLLSFKVTAFTEDGDHKVIASRAATTIPKDKFLVPGVREGARLDLDAFLNSVANNALLIPEDCVEPRLIQAQEMINLARLVEAGSRIIESTIFEDVEGPTIFIKLRRPK